MYVITGATGNTGHVIATRLLDAGQKVRVVGRSRERMQHFAEQKAEIAVADLRDESAVITAFSDATAVFAMIPPNMTSQNYRAEQDQTSDVLANAIKRTGVPNVVSLSSVGADKHDGTGPVDGLHYLEQRLNEIADLNVLHLRPAYFMENTLAQVTAIRLMGATAGPIHADLRIPMIATRDIGVAAADALLRLDFRGKRTKELHGERDLSYNEATSIIGKAIGRPDLAYKELPPSEFQAALEQMGASANVASLIAELGNALNSGHIKMLEPRSSSTTTATSYEAFVADVFVPAFG
ncbi:MAG TPA: NmrA family NAD(P)-binding protein [Pyrinomonadaceae bacterium]|nr:NmrA family NAD(P)-binding protein [Pyrinomonadaceae bacterium]